MMKVQVKTTLTFEVTIDTAKLVESGKSVEDFVGDMLDDSVESLLSQAIVYTIGDLDVKELATS